MASIAHWTRWLFAVARDVLVRPEYRAKDFWDKKHRSEGFSAVGCRRLDEEGNAKWYSRMEADLVAAVESEGIEFSESNVLEIGAGTGYWTAVVKRLGCEDYLGIDIAENAVTRLQQNFPDYRFEVTDISQRRLEGPWDVIVMIHVDEHIHGDAFIESMNSIKSLMDLDSHLFVSAYGPGTRSRVPHVEFHDLAWFEHVFPSDWIQTPPLPFADDLLLVISPSHAGPAKGV